MADSIEVRFAVETELLGLKLLPGQEANLRAAYAALRDAVVLVGAARLCSKAIISSVERTSANMTIRLASVALCSASVRQAFASDTKNTL